MEDLLKVYMYNTFNALHIIHAHMQHLKELDNSRKLVGTLQAIHTKVKEHVATSHLGCIPQPGNKLDAPINLSCTLW